MRSEHTLLRTVVHLVTRILGREDEGACAHMKRRQDLRQDRWDIYMFTQNRMRAVSKDLISQDYGENGRHSKKAIYLMEVMARISVFFNYYVADNDGFYKGATIKKECIQKTLLPMLNMLECMYAARNSSSMLPNELEIYAYQKILMMGHWFPGRNCAMGYGVQRSVIGDFMLRERWCDAAAADGSGESQLNSANARFMRLFRALESNNYTRYYAEVASSSTPFLEACLLSGTFFEVRVKQLQSLNAASRGAEYTISHLTERMCFDDDVQTLTFIEHFMYPAITHSAKIAAPGESTVRFGKPFAFWNDRVAESSYHKPTRQGSKHHLQYWNQEAVGKWIASWGPSFAHLASIRLDGKNLRDNGFEKISLFVAAEWTADDTAQLLAGLTPPGKSGPEGKWEIARRKELIRKGSAPRPFPDTPSVYTRGQSLKLVNERMGGGAPRTMKMARECFALLAQELQDGLDCATNDLAVVKLRDLTGVRTKKLTSRLHDFRKEQRELSDRLAKLENDPQKLSVVDDNGTLGVEAHLDRMKMHVQTHYDALLYPPNWLFPHIMALKDEGPRFRTNIVKRKLASFGWKSIRTALLGGDADAAAALRVAKSGGVPVRLREAKAAVAPARRERSAPLLELGSSDVAATGPSPAIVAQLRAALGDATAEESRVGLAAQNALTSTSSSNSAAEIAAKAQLTAALAALGGAAEANGRFSKGFQREDGAGLTEALNPTDAFTALKHSRQVAGEVERALAAYSASVVAAATAAAAAAAAAVLERERAAAAEVLRVEAARKAARDAEAARVEAARVAAERAAHRAQIVSVKSRLEMELRAQLSAVCDDASVLNAHLRPSGALRVGVEAAVNVAMASATSASATTQASLADPSAASAQASIAAVESVHAACVTLVECVRAAKLEWVALKQRQVAETFELGAVAAHLAAVASLPRQSSASQEALAPSQTICMPYQRAAEVEQARRDLSSLEAKWAEATSQAHHSPDAPSSLDAVATTLASLTTCVERARRSLQTVRREIHGQMNAGWRSLESTARSTRAEVGTVQRDLDSGPFRADLDLSPRTPSGRLRALSAGSAAERRRGRSDGTPVGIQMPSPAKRAHGAYLRSEDELSKAEALFAAGFEVGTSSGGGNVSNVLAEVEAWRTKQRVVAQLIEDAAAAAKEAKEQIKLARAQHYREARIAFDGWCEYIADVRAVRAAEQAQLDALESIMSRPIAITRAAFSDGASDAPSRTPVAAQRSVSAMPLSRAEVSSPFGASPTNFTALPLEQQQWLDFTQTLWRPLDVASCVAKGLHRAQLAHERNPCVALEFKTLILAEPNPSVPSSAWAAKWLCSKLGSEATARGDGQGDAARGGASLASTRVEIGGRSFLTSQLERVASVVDGRVDPVIAVARPMHLTSNWLRRFRGSGSGSAGQQRRGMDYSSDSEGAATAYGTHNIIALLCVAAADRAGGGHSTAVERLRAACERTHDGLSALCDALDAGTMATVTVLVVHPLASCAAPVADAAARRSLPILLSAEEEERLVRAYLRLDERVAQREIDGRVTHARVARLTRVNDTGANVNTTYLAPDSAQGVLCVLDESALRDALRWAAHRARPSHSLERFTVEGALASALAASMHAHPRHAYDAPSAAPLAAGGPAHWITAYNNEVRAIAQRVAHPRLRVLIAGLREFDGVFTPNGEDAPPPPHWNDERWLAQLKALLYIAILPAWPVDASYRAAACVSGDLEVAVHAAEESCLHYVRLLDYGVGDDAARRSTHRSTVLAPAALALLAELRRQLREQATVQPTTPMSADDEEGERGNAFGAISFNWRATIATLIERRNAHLMRHLERSAALGIGSAGIVEGGTLPLLYVLRESSERAFSREEGDEAGAKGYGEAALLLSPPRKSGASPSSLQKRKRGRGDGGIEASHDGSVKRSRENGSGDEEEEEKVKAEGGGMTLTLETVLAMAEAEREDDARLTAAVTAVTVAKAAASPLTPSWHDAAAAFSSSSSSGAGRSSNAAREESRAFGAPLDLESLMAEVHREEREATRFDHVLSATLLETQRLTAAFHASKEDE